MSEDDPAGSYASPPCYMHEVDPAYFGLSPQSTGADVARWRKAERKRLLAQRLEMSAETRADHAREIADRLDALIGNPAGRIVGCYWPIRGEPDLRLWLDELNRRGAQTALPVVVAKSAPLVFRLWRRGDQLERGVWNIPVPVNGKEVQPDISLAPIVGFDSQCYRLGYGGGFFDRTLAQLPPTTLAIGVGYADAEIATIYPQPFDIPMRHIVTERGVKTR
ncbi:MAG TPA: 5-formyltetrahydrofolate cyclo-ligase [Hyphomicrobiaceae bacterium]|nr:5-formyltetrahydrofolate cyclo-ligase [Hyphomicrobiaceae bacterium]